MIWTPTGQVPRSGDPRQMAAYMDEQFKSLAQLFSRLKQDTFELDLNLTGLTTTETVKSIFTIWGPFVNVNMVNTNGTSNTTAMSIDNWPVHLLPRRQQFQTLRIVDNGIGSWGLIQFDTRDVVNPEVRFSPAHTLLTLFTSSGLKGLATDNVIYCLE